MKRYIALILIVCSICLLLVGCAESQALQRESDRDGSSMFVVVERAHTWMVVYHKDTHVMYAVSDESYNYGNFTVLVNPDGSHMIYGDK